MNDVITLFAVLVGCYLLECVVRTRRHGVIFSSGPGGWRIREGNGLYGNDRHALLLANPIPWLGSTVLSEQWPVSLSREAAYSYVAQAFNPGPRPLQPEVFVRFDEIREIRADGKRVLVNEARLVDTNSALFATTLAEAIRKTRATPAEERPAVIERLLCRGFNLPEARKRVELYHSASASLRIACNLLFAHLFILCPIVVYLRHLSQTWFGLLLGLVALVAYIVVQFVRVQKRLYPEARSSVWSEAATMLLFPPAAVRAHDHVSRDLLAGFHPLVIARLLCSDETFAGFAAGMLRDLAHPISPACPSETPEHRTVEEAFRKTLTGVVREFLAQCGVEVPSPDSAPVCEEEANRTYCPRCHCQFILTEGVCSACGDLPLLPLSPHPST